jgi:hypothetical protein
MDKEVLVITDLTRMGGDRICLAGYTKDGRCIRPELPHGHFTESWLYRGSVAVVRPFAAIEFELERPNTCPPHTEDWLVRRGAAVARGQVEPQNRRAYLEGLLDADVASIFGAPIHNDYGRWVAAGGGTRSLGTVRVRVWDVVHERKDDRRNYRLVFTDSTGQRYKLAVTELAFRYFVDRARQAADGSGYTAAEHVSRMLRATEVVYLRIGLARRWQKFPDRCYLQVNGIYTFPDYLDGQCFADLVDQEKPGGRGQAAAGLDLEDLPFEDG